MNDESRQQDELRDELIEALASGDYDEEKDDIWLSLANDVLPVVRRFADAQVAAERDRIAAVRQLHYAYRATHTIGDDDICPTCQTSWPCETRYAVDGTG